LVLLPQIEWAKCAAGKLLGVIPFDQDIALSDWLIGRLIERESTAGSIRHLVESGERCRLVSMDSQLPGFAAPVQLTPVFGSVAHRHPPRARTVRSHYGAAVLRMD
jgi:hypothetical protein